MLCFGHKMLDMLQLQESSPPLAQGGQSVRDHVTVLYPKLRDAARQLLRRERLNHTLQPTALANEAAARLLRADRVWDCPEHFLAGATRVMRNLLTDYARRRLAEKRQTPISIRLQPHRPRVEEVLVLDRLLDRFSIIDPRAAQVVEFRFFGGCTDAEIAAVLGLSEHTVRRDWEFARTWLYGELVGHPRER